jgi:hypothetical protein
VQTHDSAEAGVRVPDPVAALIHQLAADLGVAPPAIRARSGAGVP